MDDDQNDIIAKMGVGLVTETASRTWARLPTALKRHQLDLVFRGPVEPYLMTSQMWLQRRSTEQVQHRYHRREPCSLSRWTRPVSCAPSR